MKTHPHICILQVAVLLFFATGIIAQSASEDFQYLHTLSDPLETPLRIASDGQGIIYTADASSQQVFKYDISGELIATIDGIKDPISVAVSKNNHLFIGDGATGYIYSYDQSNGVKLFYSETQYPTSMELGPDNTLYVADSRLQQVLVLDLSGNLIRSIGTGTLEYPTGIAFDANNHRILVGEHGGSGTGFRPTVKVYIFEQDGTLSGSFGSHGSGDGQFYRIQGITVGRCGNIYVTDPYQARVSVFTEEGEFVTKFGTFGLVDGELNIPMDLSFAAEEQIVVSSLNNGSLDFFHILDSLPSATIRDAFLMICEGESADIEIAFTGTAPWTFTYTVDGDNPETVVTSESPYLLSVSEGGHYEIVTLTDASNSGTCFTGSADVIVSSVLPSALMKGDAAICEGEEANISIDFTGSAPWSFTYTHDGGNPVAVRTANNPYNLSVSEAGLYELTSLQGGGCTGTDISGSASIVVHPLPTATLIDGNIQIYVDPGESADFPVELTGTAPWSITYTVDDLNPVYKSDISGASYVLTDSAIGTYEIKTVSDDLCSSSVSYGYPELVLNSSVDLPTSIMTGGEFFICKGEFVPIQVQFTGNAPWTFTYAVDTLMTTTIFNTYTNPYIINAIYEGSYEVIALSDSQYEGNEFTGYANVTLDQLPVPGFGYTANLLEVSFTNTSTDADSYSWDFGDGSSSLEANPVHRYEEAGEYTLSLTAKNSCGDITMLDTIQIQAVALGSLDFESHLRMYPNPSGGLLTLEMNRTDLSDWTLEIVGVNGRIIYSKEYSSGNVHEEIDLSTSPDGLYFVRIISKEHAAIKKLVLYAR